MPKGVYKRKNSAASKLGKLSHKKSPRPPAFYSKMGKDSAKKRKNLLAKIKRGLAAMKAGKF